MPNTNANNFHRRGRAEAERQLQILRQRGLSDVPRAARRINNDIDEADNTFLNMLFHIVYVALYMTYQQVRNYEYYKKHKRCRCSIDGSYVRLAKHFTDPDFVAVLNWHLFYAG